MYADYSTEAFEENTPIPEMILEPPGARMGPFFAFGPPLPMRLPFASTAPAQRGSRT